MKRLVALLSALLLLPSAGLARAAVFERDWKTPGDGLLTYDDVNQREWLDLSVSNLNQFSGTSLEDKYQNALLELLPGGALAGFTVATSSEVIDFAHSAGIDSTTLDFSVNQQPASNIIGLIGATSSFRNHTWSTGFLDTLSDPPNPIRLASQFDFNPPQSLFAGRAGLIVGGLEPFQRENAGIMLYRLVPEQASIALVLLAGFCSQLFGRCRAVFLGRWSELT